MNRKKQFTETEIATIFTQVIEAVEYIHSKGIILRDIKPENILVNIDQLQIKMCDFGWAAETSDIKWILNKAGTYVYMSPEALKGEFQTKKSDLWSLGVLMFELFFNVEPF